MLCSKGEYIRSSACFENAQAGRAKGGGDWHRLFGRCDQYLVELMSVRIDAVGLRVSAHTKPSDVLSLSRSRRGLGHARAVALLLRLDGANRGRRAETGEILAGVPQHVNTSSADKSGASAVLADEDAHALVELPESLRGFPELDAQARSVRRSPTSRDGAPRA